MARVVATDKKRKGGRAAGVLVPVFPKARRLRLRKVQSEPRSPVKIGKKSKKKAILIQIMRSQTFHKTKNFA